MPAPLVAAAAAGVASSVIGSRGASKAASAQAGASKQELKFQKKVYKEQKALNKELFRDQRNLIGQETAGNRSAADVARDAAIRESGDLRGSSAALAAQTAQRNRGIYGNALEDSLGAIEDTRGRNMRGIRSTADQLAGKVNLDRDQNIARFEREQGTTLEGLKSARDANVARFNREEDASLGYFEPTIGMGQNALQAYAHNLGLGDAPEGYTGLGLTPGAQFAMEEARNAVEGGAAARGGLYSGAAMEELQRRSQGIAAQDRDTQMAQMFGLGGLGQDAASQAAAIRANYSGRVAGERTGFARDSADVRSNYSGRIAGQRTDATGRLIDIRGGEDAALRGERTAATTGSNALRGVYAPMMAGVNDQYNSNMYNIRANDANARTNAEDTLAARLIGIGDSRIASMGTARANMANLTGQAASQYASGASSAIRNIGQAQAQGAIGNTNALMGGLQNAASVYGMTGGTFDFSRFQNPFARATPQTLPNPTNTPGAGSLY